MSRAGRALALVAVVVTVVGFVAPAAGLAGGYSAGGQHQGDRQLAGIDRGVPVASGGDRAARDGALANGASTLTTTTGGGCTSISLPYDITSSGCYTISGDITDSTATAALSISASDVIVYGRDAVIDGDGDDIAVDAGFGSNVTVRNFTATDWTTGVKYRDGSSEGTVANVDIARVSTGIDVLGSGHDLRDVSVQSAANEGVRLRGTGNMDLNDSRIGASPNALAVDVTSGGNELRNVTATGVAEGVAVSGSFSRLVGLNVSDVQTNGITLGATDNVAVNLSVINATTGVDVTAGENTITNARLLDLGSTGVSVGARNATINRTLIRNASQGITVSGTRNARIERVAIRNVDAHGIGLSGTTDSVVDNVLVRNVTSLPGQGIFVFTDGDNALDDEDDNRIRNSAVQQVPGGNGVYLSAPRNVVRNVSINDTRRGAYVLNGNENVFEDVDVRSTTRDGFTLVNSTGATINRSTVSTINSGVGIRLRRGGDNTVADTTVAPNSNNDGITVNGSANRVQNVAVRNSDEAVELVKGQLNYLTDLDLGASDIGVSIEARSVTTANNAFRNVTTFGSATAFGTTAAVPSLSRNNSVTGLHVEPGTNVSIDEAYNVSVGAPFGALPDAGGRQPIGQYLFAERKPGPSYLDFGINYSESAVPAGEEETLRIARNRTLSVGPTTATFFDVVTGDNAVDRTRNRVAANVTGLTGNRSDNPLVLAPTYPRNDTDVFPASAVGNGTATHTFLVQYLNVSGDGSTDRVYLEFPDSLAGQLSVADTGLFDLDASILATEPPSGLVDGPDNDGTIETVEVGINPSSDVDAAVAAAVNVSYDSGAQRYAVQQYIDDSSEATNRGPTAAGTVAVQQNISDTVIPATATEGSTSTHNVTVTYPSMTLDGTPDRVSLAFSNLSRNDFTISEVRLAETRSSWGIGGGFAWSETDGTNFHPSADIVAAFDLNVPGISPTYLDVEPQFEVQVTPNTTDNITVERVIADSATGATQAQTVDTIVVGNASSGGGGGGGGGGGAVTQSPSIAVSPDVIDFGQVVVNQSVTETFEVSNTGTAELFVSDIELASGDEAQFSVGRGSLSLSPGESTTVSVTYTPADSAAASVDIEIESNDEGSPVETVEVSGFGVRSDLTLNRTAIDFGTVQTGESARAALAIRNEGSANLTGLGLAVGGQNASAFAGDTVPDVVEPGEEVIANVTFAPTAAGPANATLTVSTTNAGSIGVTLRGSATGPQLSVRTGALEFGEVPVGSTATRNLTLRNGGVGTLSVGALGTEGRNATAFTTNRTSLSIPGGETRRVAVTFGPTGSGPAEANLTVSTGGAVASRVALRGTGAEANLTVSPVAVAFGSVSAGQAVTRNVTITNPGTAPLAIESATLGGRNASQYRVDGEAATGPLPGGASREFAVTFLPTADGAVSATLTLSTNDSSLPTYQLRLGGSVSAPNVRVSPGSLNFGEVQVTETVTQNLTVSNTGNAPLRVTGAAFSSGLGRAASLRTATPLTVAPGNSRELTVAFSPQAERAYSGTLRLGTNDTDESTVPIWVSNTDTTAQLDLRQTQQTKQFQADVQNATPGQEIDFNVSNEFDVNQSGDTSWTGLAIEFADQANGSAGESTLAAPGSDGLPGSALLSPAASASAGPAGSLLTSQPDREFNFSIDATSGPSPLPTTPAFETPANGTLGLQFTNVSTSFSNDIVANATMTFEVNKSRIASLNTTDPDDVAVYRYNGTAWAETNTTLVRETATTYVYRAVADGFSEWASGAQQASFEVVQADVSVSTITVGDSVNINVRIENTGGADGEFLTELLLDGEVVDSRRLEIAASGTAQVTFDRSFEQAGDYSVRVNDVPAGTVSVSGEQTASGGSTDTSSGGAGGGGGGAGTSGGSGSGGGGAGGGTGTDDGDSTGVFGPGFGVPAAVLALLAAALLARRRL